MKEVEKALEKARAALAEAIAEKETISQFYHAFVARWNTHKSQFNYLPNDSLRGWAIKDHEFELEKKALDRRFKDIDLRCEKLREEVRLTDASRAERMKELKLMKMPEGAARHIRRQENKIRGL